MRDGVKQRFEHFIAIEIMTKAISPKNKSRIVYGTKLFAGQPLLFSECARNAGFSTSCFTYPSNKFGYAVDKVLSSSLSERKKLFDQIIEEKPKAVHFWQTGILSPYIGDPKILYEYERYLKNGIQVFHRFTGFDLRLPIESANAPKNPVFEKNEWPFSHHIDLKTYKKHLNELLSFKEIKFCVGDSELGNLLERYTLTPRLFREPTFNDKALTADRFVKNPKEFRIVHAPSNTGVKGTSHIEAAIEHLKRLGFSINYTRLQNMPHSRVLEQLSKADLIIDQLLIGAPGVLTLEGWSMGKPVACYFSQEVLQDYPVCPVLNVKPDTLMDQLADLIKNEGRRKEIAAAGALVFERFHSTATAQVWLNELYNDQLPENVGQNPIYETDFRNESFKIKYYLEESFDRSLPTRFVHIAKGIIYKKLRRKTLNTIANLRVRLKRFIAQRKKSKLVANLRVRSKRFIARRIRNTTQSLSRLWKKLKRKKSNLVAKLRVRSNRFIARRIRNTTQS